MNSIILISWIALSIWFTSCRTQDNVENSQSKASISTSIDLDKIKSVIPKGDLYEYKNDSLLQILRVVYITKEKIEFELTSINRIKNTRAALTGTAKCKLAQDPEIEDDDNGEAYAAKQYNFLDKGCSLVITISRHF